MKSSYLAHGKVILIGEHAVVYGYNALALPIDALHIKTTVTSANENWLDTAEYFGPFASAPDEYQGLKFVLKTLLAMAKTSQKVKLTYTGQIPIERGLGSSAAVSFGTTQALDAYFSLHLSEKEIMNITNQAEAITHGKASGIDAATVNAHNLLFFNKKNGPQEIEIKLGATLLIMDTGELGSTKEAVQQVAQKIKTSQSAKLKMQKLGHLPDEVKKAWLKKDQVTVGQLFDQAEEILEAFSLSTKKITKLQKIAHNQGALGFKLSGSGLGGIVIALCSDQKLAKKISNLSQKLISNYWIEEI